MQWVWVGLGGIALGALAASIPRLIDRTPPVLSHESWVDPDCVAVHQKQGKVVHQGEAPDHPVFGRIQAFFVARDAGSGVRMVVRVDGEEITTDQMEKDAAFSVEFDADALGAGEHVVEVEIRDRSFWGNPITSGIDTVDYFMTADATEHERTMINTHYSEQAVLLDGQGIWYVGMSGQYDSDCRNNDVDGGGVVLHWNSMTILTSLSYR